MKAKYTIILIALGFALVYVGGLLHGREAITIITIGTILKVAGVLLFAYKIISYEGFRKFMER